MDDIKKLQKSAEVNARKVKKLKENELFKYVNRDVTKVDIKAEYVGNELIANIIKERDETRIKFNKMKNSLIFFLTKHDKPINVLDTPLLDKTLNDLCVIHKLSDIPIYFNNGFHKIEHGEIKPDEDKKLRYLKKVREGSGEL